MLGTLYAGDVPQRGGGARGAVVQRRIDEELEGEEYELYGAERQQSEENLNGSGVSFQIGHAGLHRPRPNVVGVDVGSLQFLESTAIAEAAVAEDDFDIQPTAACHRPQSYPMMSTMGSASSSRKQSRMLMTSLKRAMSGDSDEERHPRQRRTQEEQEAFIRKITLSKNTNPIQDKQVNELLKAIWKSQCARRQALIDHLEQQAASSRHLDDQAGPSTRLLTGELRLAIYQLQQS